MRLQSVGRCYAVHHSDSARARPHLPALSVVGPVLVEGGPHRAAGPRWPGLWWTACLKHPDVPAGGVKQGVVGALDPSPTSRQRVVHPVTLATRGRLDVRQVGLVLSPWTFHACMTLQASMAPTHSEAAADNSGVGSAAGAESPALSTSGESSSQTGNVP